MLSFCKDQRQVGRVALLVAAILLSSASSTFLLNEPTQMDFLGVNGGIALASNLDAGNYTCETTLTSFITFYNTTTLTETMYLTSTTVIPVSSTTVIPTGTTVTRTQVLTSTEKSVITTLSIVTRTSTGTRTSTETRTTYTNVFSTNTVTALTTSTSSARVTQTMTVLSSPVAEITTALLLLAALATLLVPRIRSRRFISKVCPQCGYGNPPYARSFCIKCGNPLEAPKT